AYRAPYRGAARRGGVGGFVADIPVDATHPSAPELDRIAAGVAALEVPALLMWGPRDPVFLERYLDDLAERLPQADVHRFEGAGHLLPDDADVAAVGVSGIGPCVLLTDDAGQPLRPAILYGVDTRTADMLQDVTAELGGEGAGDPDALLHAAGELGGTLARGVVELAAVHGLA
ncbi:alpha/beta fold hydrolase, partial [Bacillus sp. S34]|nr:alpha/beta fold hydrolase [Bacillus sp. S34]